MTLFANQSNNNCTQYDNSKTKIPPVLQMQADLTVQRCTPSMHKDIILKNIEFFNSFSQHSKCHQVRSFTLINWDKKRMKPNGLQKKGRRFNKRPEA